MANVTLSVTETALNVSTTLSNITVTDSDGGQTFNVSTISSNINVSAPVTNVIVAQSAGVSTADVRNSISAVDAGGLGSFAYNSFDGVFTYTGPSNSDIRNLFSNTSPILYNATTGVFSFDPSLVDGLYADGNVSGNISINVANGTVHTATLTGNVTGINFSNLNAGGSVVLILTQGAGGNKLLDTSTFVTNWNNWRFVGDATTLSTTAGDADILTVLYDGTYYNASLVNFTSGADTVTVNGVTITVGGSGNITTGNIAESGATNLYFSNARARSAITVSDAGGLGSLTYGGSATGILTYTGPADSEIRALITTANTSTGFGNISYNNSNGQITFERVTTANIRGSVSATDAGGLGSFAYNSSTGAFTYTGPSNSDVRNLFAAGTNMLYDSSTGTFSVTNTPQFVSVTTSSGSIYSAATISSAGNIFTTANISGGNVIATRGVISNTVTASGNVTANYFLGNGSLLTGLNLLTNAQVVAYIATQPLTVGGNLTVSGNINATGNINVQNVEDLYVRDQTIVLNANAASPANVQIVSNRPGFANTEIKWNEQTDRWTFTNDGSTYYNMATSTSDVAEGTNLYFTAARARGNISVTNVSGLGNISYNNSTGVISYVGPSAGEITANITATNTGTGFGNISYAANTAVITFSRVTGTEIRSTISAGDSNGLGSDLVQDYVRYNNSTGQFSVSEATTFVANTVPTATLTNWNGKAVGYAVDQTELTVAGNDDPGDPSLPYGFFAQGIVVDTLVQSNVATEGTVIVGRQGLYPAANVAGNVGSTVYLNNISNCASGNPFTTTKPLSPNISQIVGTIVLHNDVKHVAYDFLPWSIATANLSGGGGAVDSVNGQTGTVVLDTDDISEGTANLYYSNSRVNAFIQNNITTTDIDEGANLYYTTARANTAIGAYQGAINTAGNITTSANVQGSYILGNGAFLTGITSGGGNYGDSNVTTLLANLGSNAISSTANITTTGNISVGNIVNVTNIEGTGPFATIAMNSINPKEIILGQDFGSKIFFPYNGSPTAAVGQYLRVDSVNGSGSTLAVKNFGLSYQSIGTFGNVSAGDPANITYSQTSSVVRAGLSGDVNDITVSGVAQGDTGWIVIYQHAGSGRQLRLGSAWKMEGCTTGNPVNIAQAQDEESLIFWTYDGTNYRATVTPNIGSNVSTTIRTTGNIVGGNANITNAVNATTVNATNVNGTTVTATTANATTVNATTLVATTANATTVNGTTVNGTTVNANTIATTAASNTVSINANVNANGNIVANASLVTVTNGNNVLLNNERNLGLLIDRNNNSANVTVTTLTGTNYRGSDPGPDRIVFSSQVEGLSDGQPVTISGFTNATVAGALNGNVFYTRQIPGFPVRYAIFSDPEMTTGINLGVTNIDAGPGAITFTRRNFVTPKEWALNVDQVSNDLRIKEDGTTRVTVESGGNLNITGTANANSVVISQPGTAGTYANVIPIDSVAGVSPGSSTGFDNPSNVLVQIYESGQQFPIGNIYQLTFSGVTGPGNVNLNGQTFWSNGVDISGYADVTQLFLDSAATIPANSAVLGVTSQTVGGNVLFNFTPGTAGNNWQLSSVNGNLNIACNGTVVGNVNSAGNLTITGRHTYDRVYGEFYSNVSQSANAANTPTAITLNNTGISSDVSIVNNSNITIAKAGIYNLQFSLQLTNADNSSEHDFDVWLRKNGTNVPNSNTQYTVVRGRSGANGKNVAALNLFLDAAAGDVYQIMFAVTNTQLTVESIAQQTTPYARPATPSAIVTVAPIGA